VLDLKFSLKSISSDLLVSIDRPERVLRGNTLFLPMPRMVVYLRSGDGYHDSDCPRRGHH